MLTQKIKIGVLLDSFILPAWAYRSLERVVNLDCASISVVLINAEKEAHHYEADLYYKHDHNIVYDVGSRLDKAIFGRGPDAFAPLDIQGLLTDVPIMSITPMKAGETRKFKQSDIDEIKSYQLDILIRMGFEYLDGDILTAARYGVWSYCHGNPREPRCSQPGFWEVIDCKPETGVSLTILGQDQAIRKYIYSSWVQTYPFSPVRNRNRCFWESSSFLARQIELLSKLGDERFFIEIEKYNILADTLEPIQHKMPSGLGYLWIFTRLFFRNIVELFRRLTHADFWWLKYSINDEPPLPMIEWKELVPPWDRFWADPHIIEHHNKYYIFVEEFVYKAGKGRIAVIEMERSGAYKDSIQVLSKDYHLSYPFIFIWNEKYYMIPETSENRTIELYECVSFPHEWKFKMNLIENVIAVDTTLFYYKEKWWLFTGMTENEGAFPEAELNLFYSEELFTKEWTPHPLNPIVSDDKNARPAGRIYIENDKIYRPAQDCSKTYGWGININEILQLSESTYHEKTIAKYRPDNHSIVGMHTFSKEGRLIMIDACSQKRKLLS